MTSPSSGNGPTPQPIPLPEGVSWQDALERLVAVRDSQCALSPWNACEALFGPETAPVDPVTRDLIRRLADALEYGQNIPFGNDRALIEEARRHA